MGAAELILWFLKRRVRYRVSGSSMLPILSSMDEVLINPHSSVLVGDVVIVRHPFVESKSLVKLVKEIYVDGSMFVVGLNPKNSTDSNSLGAIPKNLLLGKVTSFLGSYES